jgi:hypothetical protein
MTRISANTSEQETKESASTILSALKELQELIAHISRNDERRVLDMIRLIVIWFAVPVTISLKTTPKAKKRSKSGSENN